MGGYLYGIYFKLLNYKNMYWIPAIFIFLELILLTNLDKLIRFESCVTLLKKYDDNNLKYYIEKEFNKMDKVLILFTVIMLLELVYFMVGFFYPIWFISTLIITYTIGYTIYSKFRTPVPIEGTIKLARLNGFVASDVKFDRLLKISELKKSEVKTKEWIGYVYSGVKIFIFIGIIYFHYNYNQVVDKNRIGYYIKTTNLIDGGKSTPYDMNIYVKEVEKYTNGMSNVELIKIEVVSGLEPNSYDYIKESNKKAFSTLVKTSDVEWLEKK